MPSDRLSPVSAAASPHRTLIVANPVSGRGGGASIGRELAEGLRRRGREVALLLTGGPGEARERAGRLGPGEVEQIVSVGGDGTLREVLAGLYRGAGVDTTPIGVVPMGTGNALGADLRLPRTVEPVLAMLEAGRTVEVDLALVNGHLSFLITGVGPDALVVKDVDDHRVQGRMSKWHYFPAAIRAYWRTSLDPLTVELDGEPVPYPCLQVLCSNLIHYGGLIKLSPERVLDDGKFEIFLFRHCGRFRLISFVVRFFLGWIPGGPIEMRRARRVRVSSARPVPYHVDGDPFGETPVELEVTGSRFRLLVP